MKPLNFNPAVFIIVILIFTFFVAAQTAREKGIELYKQGKDKEAINSLKKALAKNEKDAEILNILGLAYINIKEYDAARKTLEKAVKANPQIATYRSNLAYAYLLTRKINKSQSEIEIALQLDPKDANAYYIRGTSYLLEDKYDKAIVDADKSIELDNTLVSAYILKSDAIIFSFGKDWENRDSEKNINYLKSAVKVLEGCSAECKKKDKFNEIQDKLESVRAFYAYFQKKRDSDSSNESINSNIMPVKFITKPQPKFTDSARQKGIQGTIDLAILFGSDGEIKFILVIKGLKNGLNEEAVKAAQQIKFEPATENGKPISVVKIVEYTFTIY